MATDSETAAAISSHNTAANGHTSRGNTAGRPASPTTGDVYVNTQTGFVEVYTGATYGWEQVGGIASTPTSVVATNSGSGRAYNNGSASVAFSAGTIVGRTYTVTSSPGSYTATGSSSPLTITGLQSNTSYTYTVTATNNYGTSSASSASSAVTATTVPQAPTIGTPTPGNSSVSLAFTEGATGGSSITNYKYSTDNSTYTEFSPAQTTSPLSITGLTNGTSYQFYIKAVNANGDSQASSASNSITIGVAKATGGTTVYSGGYWYHTFRSSGTFTPNQSISNVDYLVVAGGGGAGYDGGGGGGAGGFRAFTSQSLSATAYSVTVGSGGSGSTSAGSKGSSGQTSTFNSNSSSGGGGGGSDATPAGNGGGSGGGGRINRGGNVGGQGNSGGYSPQEGNDGGAGSGVGVASGGGGGAGASGNAGTTGNGGIGTNSYSSWASATSTGDNGYYAGGGGGMGPTGVASTGGLGGGANGLGGGTVGQQPINGLENTGGGGGGNSGSGSVFIGGNGGSGIIIIRYLA